MLKKIEKERGEKIFYRPLRRLQKVGLRDKNKKNICVGDILTLDGSEYYQVVYIAPKYVLADSDGDMIFDAKPYFEEREIVGNIYEKWLLIEWVIQSRADGGV